MPFGHSESAVCTHETSVQNLNEPCQACLLVECDRLREENARLRELYDNQRGFAEQGWTIDHLMECEEALRTVTPIAARADDLEKALRFYASRTNHRGVGVSRVYNDGGRLARETLGVCPECNGDGQVKTGRKIMDQDGPYDEYGLCHACSGSGIPRA